MLDERTRAHIARELRQIEQLLDTYEDLLQTVRQRDPDLIELTALGAVLHSFYLGLENTFQTVVKRFDKNMPQGDQWHKDLLTQMVRKTDRKGGIISQTTQEILEPYLGFRHVYRHAYSFKLSWQQMQQLIGDLPDVWITERSEIRSVLDISAESGTPVDC